MIEKIECLDMSSFFKKFLENKLANEARIKVLHHLSDCCQCRDEYLDFYYAKKTKKSSLNVIRRRIKKFFKRVK